MDERMEAQRGEATSLDLRAQGVQLSPPAPDLVLQSLPSPCPSLSQIWVTGSRQPQEGNAGLAEAIA